MQLGFAITTWLDVSSLVDDWTRSLVIAVSLITIVASQVLDSIAVLIETRVWRSAAVDVCATVCIVVTIVVAVI